MQGLITVFGGTGFVGRYVVRALARDGWRLRVAARNPDLAPELKVMGAVGQIELLRCDVNDDAAVGQALAGAQGAVNLVSVLQSSGRQSFRNLNVLAAERIARAATAAGAGRLVQMSALGADAGSRSEYARTKAQGEAAVRAHAPAAVVLRPSVVFGPEDDFFNRFAAMAALVPVLPLIGGGATRFSPVYAGDVGQAVARALADDAYAGRTFELVGPETKSFRELMQALTRQIARPALLAPIPFPVAELMGAAGEGLGFFGLPAPITRDQVELLRTDNVASPGAPGLTELGVEPTAMAAVLPSYLWRFRRGGQFSETGPESPGRGPKSASAAHDATP